MKMSSYKALGSTVLGQVAGEQQLVDGDRGVTSRPWTLGWAAIDEETNKRLNMASATLVQSDSRPLLCLLSCIATTKLYIRSTPVQVMLWHCMRQRQPPTCIHLQQGTIL